MVFSILFFLHQYWKAPIFSSVHYILKLTTSYTGPYLSSYYLFICHSLFSIVHLYCVLYFGSMWSLVSLDLLCYCRIFLPLRCLFFLLVFLVRILFYLFLMQRTLVEEICFSKQLICHCSRQDKLCYFTFISRFSFLYFQ